jgi:hypothetical protein
VLHEALLRYNDSSYWAELNRTAPLRLYSEKQRRQIKIDRDLALIAAKFPNASPAAIATAYERVAYLVHHAYECGVAFWEKKVDEAGARKKLCKLCPGFAEETYDVAIKRGTFEAMW